MPIHIHIGIQIQIRAHITSATMPTFIDEAKSKLHIGQEASSEPSLCEIVTETPASAPTAALNTAATGTSEPAAAPSLQTRELTAAAASTDEWTAALALNNQARTAKGLQPLQWDTGLAQQAAAYAQSLAQQKKLVHSGITWQGENLYMNSGPAAFSNAVQSWLNEESNYTGQTINQGNFAKYGHYSTWSTLL